MNACSGANIQNMICRKHSLIIMLYHNDGIAKIPKMLQRSQKLIIIPLMKADAGLIQNIQHPHKRGTDLSCQPNPLTFPAGKGSGGTGQRQVGKPHTLQKAQPAFDLLEDRIGDHMLLFRKLELFYKTKGLRNGKLTEIRNIKPAHCHRKTDGRKPFSMAFIAGNSTHIRFDFFFNPAALGLLEAPFQIIDNPLEFRFIGHSPPPVCALKGNFFSFCPIQKNIDDFLGKFLKGGIQREMIVFRETFHIHGRNGVPFQRPAASL